MAKQYTDDERAQALAYLYASGSVRATSRALNIPRRTLVGWHKGADEASVRARRTAPKKAQEMASALERIMWQLVRSAPAKVAKAPLQVVMVALGIAFDKWEKLKAMPPAEDGSGQVDWDALTREERDTIERILEAAATRGVADRPPLEG